MPKGNSTVAEQRNYSILTVQSAKQVALGWLQSVQLANVVTFGLPEVDDRYHVWRVPLLHKGTQERLGEVVIDAQTSLLVENKSTSAATLEARLLGRTEAQVQPAQSNQRKTYALSTLRNTIALGDCEQVLPDLPAQSVDLVFTSPPYYNARPEYNDYINYEAYLLKMRKVLQLLHRVLGEE